jgi:aryl-alcohol dehydrogenase-like predicted oxidoreductase
MNMSLERLQLDYVDLIYAHRPDRHTPMEETVRAFNHLINTGKALYWGTSEWNADEIAQAWRYADKLGLIGPVMGMSLSCVLIRKIGSVADNGQNNRDTTCSSGSRSRASTRTCTARSASG